MIDETNTPNWNAENTAPPEATTAASDVPAGFCQDCGRPLTTSTARKVGNSIFCDTCLQARTAAPPPPVNAMPGEPSPVLAGFLGIIPGVGAMYNGQFAKGIAHIIVFVVLASLKDHVSDVFGLLCFGWFCYMIFDAVYTARARRDGLPLPNLFGLNDIGEHIGYGKSWPPQASPNPSQTTTAWSAPATPPPAQPQPTTAWTPVPPPVYDPANAAHQANWAGYVPPTAFGATNPYTTQPQQAAPASQPPYQPVNTAYDPTVPDPLLSAQGRRFPVAALWLIGLGVLFLLINIVPSFHISGHWIPAIVLIGATAYSLFRRVAIAAGIRSASSGNIGGPYTLQIFRVPIILATLSLIFTLQAANVRTIGQTWPLMLIVAGLLALADRFPSSQPPIPPMPPSWAAAPPPAPTQEAPAETAAAPSATEEPR